jgi:Protein of unknown function (DUF2892)
MVWLAFRLHPQGDEPVDSAATSLSIFKGERNLSFGERAAYMAAGLGIAAAGAKPRPNLLLNVLALAGGAMLAWAGYVGRCPVKAALTDGGAGRSRRRLG